MFKIAFKTPAAILCLSFISILCGTVQSRAQTELPRPKLLFIEKRDYAPITGKKMTLYRFDVENKADYPKELFAPAPDLPPCGSNANSARSWVDIYAQKSGRIYGFCALKSPEELNQLAFILPEDFALDYVYIVITDRQTNRQYKSTLVSTMTP